MSEQMACPHCGGGMIYTHQQEHYQKAVLIDGNLLVVGDVFDYELVRGGTKLRCCKCDYVQAHPLPEDFRVEHEFTYRTKDKTMSDHLKPSKTAKQLCLDTLGHISACLGEIGDDTNGDVLKSIFDKLLGANADALHLASEQKGECYVEEWRDQDELLAEFCHIAKQYPKNSYIKVKMKTKEEAVLVPTDKVAKHGLSKAFTLTTFHPPDMIEQVFGTSLYDPDGNRWLSK